MKSTPKMILAASVALLGAASAQLPGGPVAATAEEVGMLPTQRAAAASASRISEDTRNPFASRTKAIAGPATQESQTEEARLSAVLELFEINGVAKANNGGYSAQAQGLIFREGDLLPKLIDDQVDDLRVTKVTPRLVQITWVGDEDADQPRQISLPIDMAPTVAVVLPSPEKGRGPIAIIGADKMATDQK